MTWPEPGYHENVPFDAYLALDALGSTVIRAGRRSIRHMRQEMEHPKEPTDAMLRGTLLHAAVLEPSVLLEQFVVAPAFELDAANLKKDGTAPSRPKNTAYYQDAMRQFMAENEGKTVIERDQLNQMRGMVAALRADAEAMKWLSMPAVTEVSLVWQDQLTGVMLKGRLDMHPPHWLPDLKGTTDASQFERTILRYGYHVQAALYIDGLKATTGEDAGFVLIAQEADPPYCVRAAPLSQEAIAVGRDEYQRVLVEFDKCRQQNQWTGYPPIDEWRLPAWAVPEAEEALPW